MSAVSKVTLAQLKAQIDRAAFEIDEDARRMTDDLTRHVYLTGKSDGLRAASSFVDEAMVAISNWRPL